MVKFDGLTVNADGSVTLDVATNGRHLDPTTPYAGSSTGLAFQSGADVIVTNDPWTTSQFAVLTNANTWDLLQTFSVIPALPASDPTTDNQATRKAYVDTQVATAVHLTGNETVAGVKTFTSSPIVPTPTTDYQASTKKYVDDNAVFLTGDQTVAGIKTFSSFPITPSSAPTTDYQIANKKYVDDTAFAGAPDASNVAKGVSEEATEAEVRAGTATGGTGAKLFVPASLGIYLINPTGSIVMYGGGSAPTGWLLCNGQAVDRTTYADLFTAIGTTYGAGDGSTTFNVPDFKGAMPLGEGQRVETFDFEDADVNTGTDVITVPSNNWLHTGQAVVLSNAGGALPTGLSAGTYYVIRVTATTIKLATTVALANAGTAVNITASAGGGTHTLTLTLTDRSLADEGGEETHALTDSEMPSHSHTNTMGDSGGSGSPAISSNNSWDANGTVTGAINSTGSDTPHNNMPPYVTVNFIIKT